MTNRDLIVWLKKQIRNVVAGGLILAYSAIGTMVLHLVGNVGFERLLPACGLALALFVATTSVLFNRARSYQEDSSVHRRSLLAAEYSLRGTLCLVLATAGTLSAYPLLAGFKEAPYWKMPTQVVPILVGALLLPFFVAALFNFFAAVKITLPATFESRTVRNRLRAFRDRSRKKRGQLPAQK